MNIRKYFNKKHYY